MKSLKGTETAKNLMKSFAGECQARTRYTYFASKARKDGYVQISNIFMETAENEKEHAKRFYSFLENDFQGEPLKIEAEYPVEYPTDTKTNLLYAAEGEHDENSNLYPTFAKVAEEEGFPEIAACFRMITIAEKAHEKRYRKLAANIENGTVFKKDETILWKCDNCGFIFEGAQAPAKCPACLHPQAFFEVFKENY
ncbi:rubrerythrin [Clostridium baratii]|uniref:rubrerythrin n=1 Tax=Clostridium baratii TaxID=1561 RepID=UPI0005F2C681|nr:rubrerythrin family protein [Clostridium baratii]AQM59767.1 rubrerythrin family protein [Clostridium baratii]KJU71907.1 rubrerythrin [Clostridium baratii]MBS6041399.1 rubrerythrin family protein [Clostridium baratii]MBT9830908.1 rubrerythrin family protein [Clostridium baratii]STB01031.1 rubrerythrin [Clostridium baratii]